MLVDDLIFDADMKFKVYSNLGTVKVGNSNFAVNITNGGLGGETQILVFDLHSLPAKLKEILKIICTVEGLFSVYSKDTDKIPKTVNYTLKGKYNVFYVSDIRNPIVVFEKQ